MTKVRNGEKESFEYCELLVQISSSLKIRVVIVYRPPHSEDHGVPMVTFLSEFSSYMESIILSKDHLLILGDFNIHMDVSIDAYTVQFMDLLESLGLEQHVRGPNHTHGHTLDLVITWKMEDTIARPPRVCRYFSDHATVHCDMNFNKPAFQVKKILYKKVKAMDCLKGDLALLDLYNGGQGTPLSSSELDMLVRDYNASLSSIMDHHAPLKTKTVRARPQVLWYNADIAEAKRRRRKAERRWRKTRFPEDLETFKRLKNHVTYISTKARRNFYADFMRENGGDQARATRALLLPKDDLSFPEYVDGSTLANDIDRFFFRKIMNIRTDLDAAAMEAQARVHHDSVFDGDQKLHDFISLSTEEVKKLIQKSSKKSCTLDPMPTSLVVSVVDELLPSISLILNSSLSLGYFPEVWKAALIDPRLKKSGQAASLANLRPVSNLQFVSKLTERAVCDHTAEHVSRSGLHPLL